MSYQDFGDANPVRVGMTRAHIFAAIIRERERQSVKWGGVHPWGRGDCSSPDVEPIVKVAVLSEECGEVARATLENDAEQLRLELVQVAAVAVAWLESMGA